MFGNETLDGLTVQPVGAPSTGGGGATALQVIVPSVSTVSVAQPLIVSVAAGAS
ncbi:MAG: hypothetical protein IPI40_03630 [Betaproteobacteria bacterium]|nr:hypothetical protein [Betaproteobacteria bacterium]